MKINTKGFSLIEILVVVAVLGIVAAIAFPSYQDSVKKGRRADGESLLLEIAARQGRHLYTNGTYTTDLTDLNFPAANNVSSSERHYQASVLAATAGCPITTCYELRATPQGGQVDDGNLELTSTGIKRRDGNEGWK